MNEAAARTPTETPARRGTAVLALAAIVIGTVLAFATPAAWSQVPPEAAFLLNMPATVSVGDTDRQGTLSIQNPQAAPATVDTLRFAPSCGIGAGGPLNPCGNPDPGVFSVDPVAVGSGGACAGRLFAVSGPDPSGTYTITPSTPATPVELAPGMSVLPGGPDTCVVTFTFDVVGAPAQDVDPTLPGVHTLPVAGVVLGSLGEQTSGVATATVTVNPAVPSLVTQASPSARVGGMVSDTATLSGGVNPTGTITFRLYGPFGLSPEPPGCFALETSIFTSTVPVAGNGTYSSGSDVATEPGWYVWEAFSSATPTTSGRLTRVATPPRTCW